MEKSKRFFHYTTETRLEEIIQSEKILLANKSLGNKKEKPCAWVSTNIKWEPTATKLVSNEFGETKQLTFNEQLASFGCARIEVEPNGLIPWKQIKKIANMDPKIAQRMEYVGLTLGASKNDWFGSLSPIDINRWIKAEVYKDGKWIEYDVFEEE